MLEDQDRGGDTRRRALLFAGAVVVLGVGWGFYQGTGSRPATADDAGAPSASEASSTTDRPDASGASLDAGVTDPGDLDAGLPSPSAAPSDLLGDAGALPSSAPRRVKIGVVLVSFAGAEGAAPGARSRAEALTLAERLSLEAKTSFHRAVTSGDPGSSDDIGRIPRGVLDPRTELTVFTLAPGEVSEALETPRGFWIVKRIE